MLKISIIIPVFKVQGFLRECLDSILASDYPHLEVIGVDDCSPDQSGEILTEYASRDDRVRALRTPHNSGSGVARNLGFDASRGDYVWFVDSDDVICPGSIERIVDALSRYEAHRRPDVLLFDYERLDENGQTAPSDLPGLLRAGDPPAEFTFTGWPAVARYTHTVWNKVVRREYLARLGLQFHPGWYQDVPWSYPLLIHARRMALLNVPCYRYRQRRAGSVTRTLTDRHLEVFTQWERTWNHVSDIDDGTVRALVFNRMIWHCMQVLGNDGRITRSTRRRFFQQAADMFDRWHPGDRYIEPSAGEGAKHRLLRRRRYVGYLLMRLARRTYNRVRFGHPHGRYSSRGLGTEVKAAMARWRRRVTDVASMTYRWHRLRPVQPDLVVLATAGYGRPSGVCAAIDDAIADLLPQYRRVWITTAGRPQDTAVAPKTAAANRVLGRAKYLITDFDMSGLGPKRPGGVQVRALAETPVTAIGLDRHRVAGAEPVDAEDWFTAADRWDFVVTPNRHSSEVVDRAFQVRAEHLEFGMPRQAVTPRLTDQVRSRLGVPDGHRLVFYHPAERPGGLPAPEVDPVALEAVLPMTTVVVLDGQDRLTRSDEAGGTVRSVSPVSAAELYLAADLVVGDYRGALIDHAAAGRHTVLYVPDWEAVRATGFVTVDVVAEPPGPVAHDWDTLLKRLEEPPAPVAPGAGFIHRYGDWVHGDAAESVVRRVFGLAPAGLAMSDHPEAAPSSGPATESEASSPLSAITAGIVTP